jgi:ATP/maltotriose-dependent transcriptional regulator MalT
VWGTVLAAILAGSAAAQTADFSKRLIEGQRLRDRAQFAEARTVYQALLRDVRQNPSERDFEALVWAYLGVNEQDSGDYGAAETAYNHGLAAVHSQTADNAILAALETHLAELYIAEGRADDAEPMIRQAVAALRSSATPDRVSLATANEDLAVVCIMRRKLSPEPEALLRQSQTLLESVYGPEDPRVTSSLLTYAGLMTEHRRYAEAVVPAEHAWQILDAHSPSVPKAYLASALNVMAAVYYHTGRRDKAESCARKSVDLATSSIGPTHPRLGLYLANFAFILKSAGHKNEAKAVQKQADAILNHSPVSGSGGYTVNIASLR